MKKIITIILVVALAIAAVGYFVWESGSYVAKVGNRKIKSHEYTFFLLVQKKTTEREADIVDEQGAEEFWKNPVGGEDPVTIVMNQALENAKEYKIQIIKAEKEKYGLSDQELKEIQDYLNNLMKDKEYVNYVREDFGLTPAQFKDMMLKSQLVESFAYDFMQKNRDAISVDDEEVKAYYDENRGSIDDVTVRHLLISTDIEGITEEQKQEKKKLAEDLFRRIQQGEDMTVLVSEYSEDPAVTQNNGVYTFTYIQAVEQSYAPEFRDWAFQADTGETDIVETGSGYHIMRLENKNTFEEKKELVKSTIKAMKLNEYYYNQVAEWNKDPAYNLVKNENVLNKVTRKHIP